MKHILRFLLSMAILLVISGMYNQLVFQYRFQDALIRTLLLPFIDTTWAPSYNESKFTKIKLGMNKELVLSLLGEPLRESCLDLCEWVYSWPKDPTASFDRRVVYFNSKGEVAEIVKDVFID